MLTKKQKQILDFIISYIKKNKISPTRKEIAKNLGLSSVSNIQQHLDALALKKYIRINPGISRNIELIEKVSDFVKIPLKGTIAAGQPIEGIEEKENIAIPKEKVLKAGNMFALRIKGNSMIEENINDGDIVLIKEQSTAENGQKVVALIDNSEVTLKTFFKERNFIRLQPANKNMSPIIIEADRDFAIQGVLFDIIKNYKVEQSAQTLILPIAKKDTHQQKVNPYFEESGFTLYHGDCLNILTRLPANSVDMIFADPPYNLSNNGFSLHAGRRVSVNKGMWDKSKGFENDYNFHHKWLDACKRVLKPQGTLWVSGTYHSIYQCGYALQSLGYHILNDISWFKPNGSPNLSCRYFTASHETLIWARKDKKEKHIFNYELMKNGNWSEDFIKKPNLQMRSVWAIYPPKKDEKEFGKHPTQKPIELLKRIILASTKPNAIILDPFTGSSTTGIASEIIGKRKFIGIDTKQEFLDISIKRFKEVKCNLISRQANQLKPGAAAWSTSV